MTNPTDTDLLEFQNTQGLSIRRTLGPAGYQWIAVDTNRGTIATAPTPREALLAAFMWANGMKR